jgi:hypothetical protein
MTVDRRKQAAAMTRQKSKDSQQASSGKSYLKWSGKSVEPKAKTTSILSVIPYTIKEKHHPQNLPTGTLWYRRPFKVHRNMGIADDARTLVCPRSFNSKADCAPCRDVAEMLKDWDTNEDAIKAVRASARDLMLVYDHEDREIKLLNQSYFLFGQLLDERIDNPPSEDCAAFWLDGEDGMALKVSWMAQKAGKLEFVKASVIDFDQDKKYKVPSKVWKEAIELSTLLVETTSRQIEEIYTGGSNQTDDDDDSRPDDDSFEDVLSRMGKKDMIAYAKDNQLMADKDVRFLLRMTEDEVRAKVRETIDKDIPFDSKPAAGGKLECPLGHTLGEHLNDFDECGECPEDTYNACARAVV